MTSLSERIHRVACGSKAWHLGMLSSEVAGLEIQLAALQAENAKLRECVELYADKDNWGAVVYIDGYSAEKWFGDGEGPEPAQNCLDELKLTNPNRKETNERINQPSC